MTAYNDHYARWSYEQLLMQQPHIEFHGLWRKGHQHYILCPDVKSARTAEGTELIRWFDHSCRVITASVKIVATCPPDAERVPERSSAERALLAGAPRNRRALLVDLGLLLPSEFPPFTIDTPNADVVMVTHRELTPIETEQAQSAYASLGYHTPLTFSVDAKRNPEHEEFRYRVGQGDIDLIPSRRLTSKVSRELRLLIENDEQFWVESRNTVLTTFHAKPSTLLPDAWAATRSLGCLVDATVFAPDNMRAYLSLYDTVYLALPISDVFEQNCAALGVTSDELLQLVQTGRVKVILPQSVDRYPLQWLNSAAEAASGNLLLSRRLAAATISDARRRMPFLFAPLSPTDRYAILHSLAIHAQELADEAKRQQVVSFFSELGNAWSQSEWSVQSCGAMGTSQVGIGRVAGTIHEQLTGLDLRVEIWSAAQKVEWAAALGAHTFPTFTPDYDETNACAFVAGVYGPMVHQQPPLSPQRALSAIKDLLAIDNRASVVDFAKEFSSADIHRLRDLVLRLTQENIDPDHLNDAIRKFNAEVRHYEKRPDLLKSLNLVGLISAGVVATGVVDPSIQKVVPLAGVTLGFLVNRIIDEVPRYSATVGSIIDYLNSILALKVNAGAVLIARARKDISRLKK